jgi:ATP-binding cassette, subfamily B, bacterial
MTEGLQTAPEFVEAESPALAAAIGGRLDPGEGIHIRMVADMADVTRYGERWLLVTERRVLLVSVPGPGSEGQTREILLSEVGQVRTQELVGAGQLEIERKDLQAQEVIHYSRSVAARFSEAAEAIRNLAKGEPPGLPTELERTRCDTCHRLLPERDGICPFCIRRRDTIKRIAMFLEPQKKRVFLFMAVSLVMSVLGLLPPQLVRFVVDTLEDPPDDALEQLGWLVGALAATTLVHWFFEIADGFLRSELAGRTAHNIRQQLYGAMQFLPVRFFDKRQVGSLISRFMQDADRLEMFLLFGLPFVLSNFLMLVGVLFILLYMSWELTLFVLFPVPFIVIGGLKKFGTLRRLWTQWHTKWSQFNVHLNESIHGIRVVKAFAQEPRELRRFTRGNDELRDMSVTAERSWFIFSAVLNFIMSFGLFFTWYFGGRAILDEELTLGDLMAFISYIWMLYGPLQFFSNVNNFLTRAFAGAERIFEVLDARPEPFESVDAKALCDVRGRIVFRDVWFGYDPGKPILKDVGLVVEPGEMIGLVGKSGVGKSTLINLICRFYDADKGAIELDGDDLRDIRLKDLRSQIGMVAQESFLFNGTIAENIAYGREDASFEDIIRAAQAANAHEFIITKPEGYDMLAGERGGRLSGGEKQRIAIARAILHDPKILILDEATSAVDTPTEKKLQEAIQRLVAGRTTFAIAHRLSTLRSANRLVVIDDGKVAEVGTHAELMEREGIFHKLVTTQQQTTAVMAVGRE